MNSSLDLRRFCFAVVRYVSLCFAMFRYGSLWFAMVRYVSLFSSFRSNMYSLGSVMKCNQIKVIGYPFKKDEFK